jgi:hypothetical protein
MQVWNKMMTSSNRVRFFFFNVWLLFLLFFSAKTYASIGDCLVCHNNKEFEMTLDNGSTVSLYINSGKFRSSIHGKFDCVICHTDYKVNIHEQKMQESKTDNKEIDIIAKTKGRQKIVLLSCINCHKKEFNDYRQSIHGKVALEGNHDAPECIDCHGSHYIRPSDDLESTVNPSEAPTTCAKCHNEALLMARYDINTYTYITYEESFHGKKLKLGSGRVPACTSCHGVHNIRAPEDPASEVNEANRLKTCGKCHTGASAKFVLGFSHNMPSPKVDPIIFYVGLIYKWFIIIMISAMAIYVILDFFKTIFVRRS